MSNQSDTKRLIITVSVLSALSAMIVGVVAMTKLDGLLHQSTGTDKARAVTVTLSHALEDPFSMGEYDHMQKLLQQLQETDPDIKYSVIVSSDGRSIATTDPSLRNMRLTRNNFEKETLQLTEYTSRTLADQNIKEAAAPIKSGDMVAGFLRVGYKDTAASDAAKMDILSSIIAAAIVAVVLNTVLFTVMCKKSTPTTGS